MVANEYGGDVGRAQAAVAEMQSAIDKAPSTGAANDAKAMLREQMGRLVAGIEATKNGAAQPSKAPATQAAAAKPARPMQDATQGASTSGPDASPEGATLDTARATKFPLPLASTAHQMFMQASTAGFGKEDDAAVIKIFPGIELPGKR